MREDAAALGLRAGEARAEAFRMLRNRLRSDGDPKLVAVTSPRGDEGGRGKPQGRP